jgi:hypothetical protein
MFGSNFPQSERDFVTRSVILGDGDSSENSGKPYPQNDFGDTSLNIVNI